MLAPPTTFRERIRHLGPSLILTGGIVGSGELIVTTTLGAQIGFVALWLIIASCLLKVIAQIEIGRYAIAARETSLQAVNHIPGPRWKVSWVVWCWVVMMLAITLQVAGIVGGVGQSLNILIPGVGTIGWGILACFFTLALLLSGRYKIIEGISALLVVSFTLTAIVSASLIQLTPHAIRIHEILEGFKFHLPPHGLSVVFAVFGITGVGTTELFYYPNWCLEKGYASFAGSTKLDPGWEQRARGWIRVMQLDALMAMLIYTTATVAFYLLGAAVLHRMALVPHGEEMVLILSKMCTETLGPWAFVLFVAGAFFVLYSSLFVAIASNSLMAVDCLGLFSAAGSFNRRHRLLRLRIFVILLSVLYGSIAILFKEPVGMVVIGGIAQTAMLPITCFSILYLMYRRLDVRLRPSRWIRGLLWISSFLTLGVALYAWVRHLFP